MKIKKCWWKWRTLWKWRTTDGHEKEKWQSWTWQELWQCHKLEILITDKEKNENDNAEHWKMMKTNINLKNSENEEPDEKRQWK